MASYNVFVIYSESDQTKVSDLIKDIRNVTLFPLNQGHTQINEEDKNKILECSVFLCFLSSNSSPLLFNIVKFARCVARKKINTYFIERDGFLTTKEKQCFLEYEKNQKEYEKNPKKTPKPIKPKIIEYSSDIGIQNFFNYKTRIIESISDIEEVSIILEFIHFYDH